MCWCIAKLDIRQLKFFNMSLGLILLGPLYLLKVTYLTVGAGTISLWLIRMVCKRSLLSITGDLCRIRTISESCMVLLCPKYFTFLLQAKFYIQTFNWAQMHQCSLLWYFVSLILYCDVEIDILLLHCSIHWVLIFLSWYIILNGGNHIIVFLMLK